MGELTKESATKLLDEKIKKFTEKVDNLVITFNETLLDRKEIMEIISAMESKNWITDEEKISAIKVKLDEING